MKLLYFIIKKILKILPFSWWLISYPVFAQSSDQIKIGIAQIRADCWINGNCDFCDFVQLFVGLANWGYTILGTAALLFFIYGGIMLLISGGMMGSEQNPGRLIKAKKILNGTIVGIILILSSWLIVNTIIGALTGTYPQPGKIFQGKWWEIPECANY